MWGVNSLKTIHRVNIDTERRWKKTNKIRQYFRENLFTFQ